MMRAQAAVTGAGALVGGEKRHPHLLAVQHLPDRVRLRPVRVPDMDGEDQRVPPGIVVEHGFRGGVREDAAVPIKLAVDPHRREGRRQRTGGHDVPDAKPGVTAVEIAHLAGADMGGADTGIRLPLRLPPLPTRPSSLPGIEVDAVGHRLDLQMARIELAALAKSLNLTQASRFVTLLDVAGIDRKTRDPEGPPFRERGFDVQFQIPIFDLAHYADSSARQVQDLLATAECLLTHVGARRRVWDEEGRKPESSTSECEARAGAERSDQ